MRPFAAPLEASYSALLISRVSRSCSSSATSLDSTARIPICSAARARPPSWRYMSFTVVTPHVDDAVALDHHGAAEDHLVGVVHGDDGPVPDDDAIAHELLPSPGEVPAQREMPCPDCGTADVRSTQIDLDCRYGSSASAP